MRLNRISSVALASLLTLTACRKAEVASYRVPKEAPPPAPLALPGGMSGDMSGPDMATTPVPTASGAGLTWTAPATWTKLDPARMRRAGYRIDGPAGTSAELTVTAFPGDVGGDLANINRWRNQLQLSPLEPAALDGVISVQPFNGREFKLVDLSNTATPPQRTLAAYTEHDGSTWFFKLTGDDQAIAAAKAVFLDFLNTVRPE